MFVVATTYRFFSEEREKRRARETFSRFLAPAIVDEVLAKGGAVRLGGEKRVLTVLFSDIRGFTGISEQLDPHVLLELLNEYLTPMTDIIVSGAPGHARQVHRRRDHGVLGRAAGSSPTTRCAPAAPRSR